METRDTLVEHATRLVQKTGFAGFSYADLSDSVGIRKASIHHHFPAKADLGLEIVERYRKSFGDELSAIDDREATATKRLKAYAGLYRRGVRAGTSCLCGVLAAESDGLPRRVQSAVNAFFNDNTAWLEKVIKEGRRLGELNECLPAVREARGVLAALQGAMLIARAQGDERVFDDAIQPMFSSLLK